MTTSLSAIVDKAVSAGPLNRVMSAGIGAALGAVLGPTAASLTGDKATSQNTLVRDMLAGALGGAIGGLTAGVGGGALGASLTGGIAGMFDQEKKSSLGGQDLRLPVMGGTKFPTQDSVSAASKRLQQSSAEVGPQPAKTASIGDPMLTNDPLVRYLKKLADAEAKDPPPLTGLVDSDGVLDDNLPEMPLGREETELASACPMPTPRMHEKVEEDTKDPIGLLFENSRALRKKCHDKDHPFEGFDQGVIDRVLGL